MKHYQKPHINKVKKRQQFEQYLRRGKDLAPVLTIYFKRDYIIRVFAGYAITQLPEEDRLRAAREYDDWFNGGEIPKLLPSVLFGENGVEDYIKEMEGEKSFIDFIVPVFSRYIPKAV